MSNFKGWEIIIVLALLLLLFGAKRLPDAARGLGRSLRIFKAETKGLRDDDEPANASAPGTAEHTER
jgi:sec-independent protein translocase protein TatA